MQAVVTLIMSNIDKLLTRLDTIEQLGRRYVAKGYHVDQFDQSVREIRAAIISISEGDRSLRDRILAVCNQRRHYGLLRNQIVALLGSSDVERLGRIQVDVAGLINDAPHITIVTEMVASPTKPAAANKFYITIPAWGKDYVDTAIKFTVPAILASLNAASIKANFLIYTDLPDKFKESMPQSAWSYIKFLNHISLPTYRPPKDPHPREYWAAFMAAHRDALAQTPWGSILCMWNADIVPSIECFRVVNEVFSNNGHKKVIASVGIRTLLDGNECPVGADAVTLNKWIWSHLHPISRECIWDSGHSDHPTILFFEDGENVSMHGFHLTPMFIRVDRKVIFRGTIDDDLMSQYKDDEIHYLSDGSVGFAELSYAWKGHPNAGSLTVESVTAFGKRRFSKAHIRNFGQRFKIIGNPIRNHQAVDQILSRLC